MIKRIPKRFYDDCIECDTLVPALVRQTRAHYYIDTDVGDGDATAKETMADFISRARYYSDEDGFDQHVRGICKSAGATLIAIDEPVPATIKQITKSCK